MAPLAGLEPATHGLEIRCSIQLSYRGWNFGLEVLRLEPRVTSNTGKHRGAEFDGIVERKYEIRITVSGENAVRCATLPLDPPTDT